MTMCLDNFSSFFGVPWIEKVEKFFCRLRSKFHPARIHAELQAARGLPVSPVQPNDTSCLRSDSYLATFTILFPFRW
jgi:hypothetical protein